MGVRTGREPSDSEDLAVGERSVTHGPPPPRNQRPDRTRITFIAESATAPRLMPLGFIGFPHVADCASLVVNVRLLILQPLARLCVRCRISVMNWKPAILTARAVTSSITHIGAAGDYVGRGKTLPIIYNRGAVAHLAARVIRVLSGRHRFGCL